MKHGKMDHRYNGYPDFQYHVVFLQYKENEQFFEMRNWCWEQWGPSMEWDIWTRMPFKHNPSWAWIHDTYKVKLLLRDKQEYSWFLLKWC